jgi:tight adherence protein B
VNTDATGLLAGLCGAAVAAGLLLIVAGLRPVVVDGGAVPGRRAWAAAAVRAQAGLRRRGALLGAALAGLAVGMVTGWPVAGLGAGGAVLAAPRLVSGSPGRAQLARLEALEAWIRRLGDLLGSGIGGLEQAIEMSVRTCPAPIVQEVAALAGRLRLYGAEAALRGFADDLADIGTPAADLAAAALILRVRRGGRGLRPVLEALAADIAESVRSRRAVEADRAKPIANVRALLGITGTVLGASLLFAGDFLAPFGTPTGQLALAAILALFGTAVALLARITRPPATPRFLPPAATRPTPSTRDTTPPLPQPASNPWPAATPVGGGGDRSWT